MDITIDQPPPGSEIFGTALEYLMYINIILCLLGLVCGPIAYLLRKKGVPFLLGRFAMFAVIAHSVALLIAVMFIVGMAFEIKKGDRPSLPEVVAILSVVIVAPALAGILSWLIVRKAAKAVCWPSLSEGGR